MPSVLEQTDEGRRLTVLNIGPALPETVDFFAQYKCRLYFADVCAEPTFFQHDEELSAGELDANFRNFFDYPKQTKFDICLLWDVLNYLDNSALEAFSKALNPFLNSATRIHGYSTLKASVKLPNQQFSINRNDCLKIRPRHDEQAPYYSRSQMALNKLLYGMAVSKAKLLTNGLLEVLLKADNSLQDDLKLHVRQGDLGV